MDVRVGYVLDALPRLDDPSVEVTGGGRDGAPVWRVRVTCPDRSLVSLVYLAGDADGAAGPWRGLTAHELWSVFSQWARLVGVGWSDSVGHSAERLILATHPRERGGATLDASPVTPEPAQAGNLEMPFGSGNWRRALTGYERTGLYVHAFDQNAQYLAAWVTVELGHGTPVHHVAPRFDGKVAGLWRIGTEQLPPLLDATLPPAWIEGREWFTTPTVTRMLEACAGFDAPMIAEAWLWPRKSRFLRTAGERLRDTRAQCMQAVREAQAALDGLGADDSAAERAGDLVHRVVVAGAVGEAVKLCYAWQTGRFNQAGRDERSGWRRPDWGHTIRAQARVNLHRRLSTLAVRPFAIATDGLLFASSIADPVAFAESIRLPLGDGLGQFVPDASCPSRPVFEKLDAMLESGGRKVGELFAAVEAHKLAAVAVTS